MNQTISSDLVKDDKLIMIVDDQETQRLLFTNALQGDGFSTYETQSGEETIEALNTITPEAILLDVMMPGMDGFETCRRIRNIPKGKHLPIMMITGRDDNEAIHMSYEVGATDFITKPVNHIILCQRIRYMLRGSNAVKELRRSEAQLAKAQEIARMGSWEWKPNDDQMYWSRGMYEILGFDQATEKPDMDKFLQLLSKEHREIVNSDINRCIKDNISVNLEISLNSNNIPRRYLRLRCEPLHLEQEKDVIVSGTILDITESKKSQEKIHQLAYFDSLTGLPNRAYIIECLQRIIPQVKRSGSSISVYHIALDKFKHVNDYMGRAKGDKILIQVTEIITECLISSGFVQLASNFNIDDINLNKNCFILSRLEGDQFIAVITNIDSINETGLIAKRLVQTIAKPLILYDKPLSVTASIGISTYPETSNDVESLLANTNLAMFEAKRQGRNIYQLYTRDIQESLMYKLRLERELQETLNSGGLEVYYQPKINIKTNKIVGMEALVRWPRDDGFISPVEFIPIAEESDLIIDVGNWILQQACIQTKIWNERVNQPLEISVNLSARQFHQHDLLDVVKKCLVNSGLEPNLLCLELTEGVLMEEKKLSATTLKLLKEMDIKIAIDDFGTGYSSLNYLKSFPINSLKIDRSFIRDLPGDSQNKPIVIAVISLAHNLGLSVVAEGVETEEQLDFLRTLQCDQAQGYFYSKPLSTTDFADKFIDVSESIVHK